MSDKILKNQIDGAGGGGSTQQVVATPAPPPIQYTPIESPNTLQSRDAYRVIELLCEGEISGLVDGHKSIFINDVPLQNANNSYNYSGITISTKTGIIGQDPIPGFPSIETPISVDVELTVSTGTITRVVTDENVDAVYIVVTIPALYQQKANGDRVGSIVMFSIQINSGAVETKTVIGKCMSTYRDTYRVTLPVGGAPWLIKLTRITPDSTSDQLSNKTYWSSYTELIDHKIEYRNSALVAAALNAELFGNQIPTRSYLIRGLKVLIPVGYTPPYKVNGVWQAAVYPASWNGTFQSAQYTSNPAWCLYDLLINDVYGAGIDPGTALKWLLYTIAQRCDELILNGYGGLEPRYTINCVLLTQQEAYALINQIVGVFHGLSWGGPGAVMVSQDAPASPQILATPANVIDGEFTYEGGGLKERYSVCLVTWNDPDDHFRPAIEPVTDSDLLLKYGYKPIEIAPLGCTSRGFAHRLGRWVLDTAATVTQMVSYRAGLDHGFVSPGAIIAVADPFFANVVLGGLIKLVVTTTITLDRAVILATGETYTLWGTLPDGTLESKVITTTSDGLGHTVITIISAFSTAPQVDSVWTLTGTDVQPRLFTCLSNTEFEFNGGIAYQISGLFYDPNKFARIEDALELESPVYSLGYPTGVILPPSNVELLLDTRYIDGNLYNIIMFTWEQSSDERVIAYNVEYKPGDDANWIVKESTAGFNVELNSIQHAHYYFRVQSLTRTGATSLWIYDDLDIVVDIMPDVTGLVLVDGVSSTEFFGGNAKFTWNATSISTVPTIGGVDLWFKSYVVQIWKSGVLVRTEYPVINQYEYTFEKNTIDSGPNRTFTIRVYQLGNLGQISSTGAILTVSNPAPSMAGFTPTATDIFKGIQLNWAAWSTSDADVTKIQVFLDTASPPITLVATVDHVATGTTINNLEVGTEYNIRLLPWDAFGVGVYSAETDGTPLILEGIDVDIELSESITITDSDGNSPEILSALYDRVTDDAGVTYILSGYDKWIDYTFQIETYIDKIIIHTGDAYGRVYFATSVDGTTWTWFRATTLHYLNDGKVIVALSQVVARTNYLQLVAGLNAITLPQKITAKHCRLYFTGSYSTVIYELVFVREVIAEQIVADNLSAISANLGSITSGYMQSANYTATAGVKFDLNNSEIHLGGSTGGVSVPGFSYDPTNFGKFYGEITITTISNPATARTQLNVEDGATANIISGNLCRNATFDAVDSSGHPVDWVHASTGDFTYTLGIVYNEAWNLKNGVTAWLYQSNTITTGYAEIYTDVPAMVGKRFGISCYTGAHRCEVVLKLEFFDNADVVLYSSTPDAASTNHHEKLGGSLLSGYKRLVVSAVAPTNTSYIRARLIKYGTHVPSNSFMFATQCMIAEMTTVQTEYPAWSPNSSTTASALDGGLDTTTGGLIVRDEVSGDYAHLTSGGLNFWYYNDIAQQHVLAKSVRHVESGLAIVNSIDGVTVNIPGYFRSMPHIQVFPASMQTYSSAYPAASQTAVCTFNNLQNNGDDTWSFRALNRLDVSPSSVSGSWPTASAGSHLGTIVTLIITPPAQPVNRLIVSDIYGYAFTATGAGGTCTWYKVTIKCYVTLSISGLTLIYSVYDPASHGAIDYTCPADQTITNFYITVTGSNVLDYQVACDNPITDIVAYVTMPYIYYARATSISVSGTTGWLAIGD